MTNGSPPPYLSVPPTERAARPSSAGRGPVPVVPLGYGRPDGRSRIGRRVSAAVGERADGAAEFLGMLIAATGGPRQLALAVGAACAAYGVALIAARGGDGPGWVAVGAFLVGLVVPLPRRRAGDADVAPMSSSSK